jgi:hypothetical protein
LWFYAGTHGYVFVTKDRDAAELGGPARRAAEGCPAAHRQLQCECCRSRARRNVDAIAVRFSTPVLIAVGSWLLLAPIGGYLAVRQK